MKIRRVSYVKVRPRTYYSNYHSENISQRTWNCVKKPVPIHFPQETRQLCSVIAAVSGSVSRWVQAKVFSCSIMNQSIFLFRTAWVYHPGNMVKSRGKPSCYKGLRTNQTVQPPKSFKSQSSKFAAHHNFQIPAIAFAEPELHWKHHFPVVCLWGVLTDVVKLSKYLKLTPGSSKSLLRL